MKNFSCVLTKTAVAVGIALAVTGCGDDNNDDNTTSVGTLSFEGVAAPETDADKRAVQVSPSVVVDGESYGIGYHTIMRSGDTHTESRAMTATTGTSAFGQLFDSEGNALYNTDGSPRISNDNDFASLLTGTDGKPYMVSHFETRPGIMYVTELDQNAETGELSAVRTRHIDFSLFNGGWVHCAGSVTPWGTHLGSEEYEPDASARDPLTGSIDDYYDAMGDYFGGDLLALNPYDYGYQIEVAVDDFDSVDATKHYAMGRVAHELGYVLPDRKTAYISDDGTNVGLFMFKADTGGDLSAGELFVAKWMQTSTENGGAADLEWISLGHATDAQIKEYLDAGVTYADIFDEVDPNEDDTCPDGYTSVNHSYGFECLKLKPGMEVAASRMETRRYAAMLGGTTEFRKMEGITHNPDGNVLYVAMSEVARGMEDFMKNGSESSSYDKGGPNDIRLPFNNCGVVYALDLDENYTATKMRGLVAGIPVTADYGAADDSQAYDPDGPFANNTCHLDGLANPDNLTFIPGHQTLIIGEDTGDGHQNDAVWAYDLESAILTRIETTPYGSETTSPYFYPNFNGWGYLMSVIQHPFGESDEDKSTGAEEERAYTGYIGPFPAMD